MKIYGDKPEAPKGKGDWRSGKVVVMQALTDTQVTSVIEQRKAGLSDTQIWRSLHARRDAAAEKPCQKTAEFTVKLEQLTKPQLVLLIENTMGCAMHSLEKMKREDLIKLIRNFGEAKQPRVTLTP